MNYFRLVFSRITGYLREKRLLMALYIGSYILCVLVFIYAYNNFMPSVTREGRNNSIDRYYNFYLDGENIDAVEVTRVIEKYDPDYITFNHEVADHDGIEIQAYYKNEIIAPVSGGMVDIGKYGGNHIIFPETTEEYGSRPKTVTLDGRSYEVAGWSSTIGTCVISMQGYIDNGLSTSNVEVYLNRVLSYEKSEEFIGELAQLMEIQSVNSPERYIEEEQRDNRIGIVSISLGFFAMMLIFGFLVKYIVQTSKREDGIYLLVGAGKGEVIGIIFLEHIIMNLALSVAAVLLHLILYYPIFGKINFYDNVHMSFADYVTVVAVTSLLSFVIILPHLIKSYRYSVADFRRC
ncbi:MAG: hypothetical protein NC223_07455 [Butyrivibrio sp.]|nr:hypothetical protein [Butyrivibrio sp.]